MLTPQRRSLLEIAFLVCLAILSLGYLGCGGCLSGYGSDHDESSLGLLSGVRDEPAATLAGRLRRWHDFSATNVTLTAKDLQFIRSLAAETWAIGLQVPTAAGANQPGDLTSAAHKIFFLYNGRQVQIPLLADAEKAAEIAAVFPPEPNAHWQALVLANRDWLTSVPTQTTTFNNVGGSLFYELDFHGSAYCNGCEVKVTFCTDMYVPPILEPALLASGAGPISRDPGGLSCSQPGQTIVVVADNQGKPKAGMPLVAAFGYWGGQVITSTFGPTVTIPMSLQHTGKTAQTFNLEPIHSARGWSYAWADMSRQPISQLTVPGGQTTAGANNLQVIGTGLPTCSTLLDTIHLTATHATTTTVQAIRSTAIEVLPDPARCAVADLSISQTASASSVAAGDWVTISLSVANHETRLVSALVTATLEPLPALGSIVLPPECERRGGAVSCLLPNLPARGSRSLDIAIRTAPFYVGRVSSVALVGPHEAVDARGYDNWAGPLDVTVTRSWWPAFLPWMRRE